MNPGDRAILDSALNLLDQTDKNEESKVSLPVWTDQTHGLVKEGPRRYSDEDTLKSGIWTWNASPTILTDGSGSVPPSSCILTYEDTLEWSSRILRPLNLKDVSHAAKTDPATETNTWVPIKTNNDTHFSRLTWPQSA